MFKILPPLRVHTWGGLGSQLFAIALADDLFHRFPKRTVRIILHTGGVTLRDPEVTDVFPEFNYGYVQDFKPYSRATNGEMEKSNNGLRKFIKILAFKTGFLAFCNDDAETNNLSPWVLSIRGHYAYRNINSDFLEKLFNAMIRQCPINDQNQDCSIHYRLGDLLSINEKSPIAANSIISEYSRIDKEIEFSKVVIFSDSPIEARSRFSSFGEKELVFPDISTLEVLSQSVHSKYFIGTSSKISFWIAAIRAVVHERKSSLPESNANQYSTLLGDKLKLIQTYLSNSQ